jgi:hypothetical protein
MKRIYYILIAILGLNSCGGSKKALDIGDYNTAVYKAVKALQRKETKEKDILTLQEAYPKAVERDMKEINQLKLEGAPESWERIYYIYKALDDRQELVKTVAPIQFEGREIDFEYADYQKNMVEAKQRAANFYYTNAKELMKNDDQTSNRKAYEQLKKIKKFYATYEDVEQLMEEAKFLGTSHALISIKNEAEYNFDRAYLAELLNFGIADLNSDWKNFYTNFNENINYDYDIIVSLTNTNFTEAIRERSEYVDKKVIKDGWEYVLDERGNVKKDSAGNDMKKEKFKTIECKVIKEIQKKSLIVIANIQYINKVTNQVVGNSRAEATENFVHESASAQGNTEALTDASKEAIKRNPIPFPSNEEMLNSVKINLRNSIKNSIKSNLNFIK